MLICFFVTERYNKSNKTNLGGIFLLLTTSDGERAHKYELKRTLICPLRTYKCIFALRDKETGAC